LDRSSRKCQMTLPWCLDAAAASPPTPRLLRGASSTGSRPWPVGCELHPPPPCDRRRRFYPSHHHRYGVMSAAMLRCHPARPLPPRPSLEIRPRPVPLSPRRRPSLRRRWRGAPSSVARHSTIPCLGAGTGASDGDGDADADARAQLSSGEERLNNDKTIIINMTYRWAGFKG
jgi:hypothetical protein